MSYILFNGVHKKKDFKGQENDKIKIAKESSNMTVLVHNKKKDSVEIQTVWQACAILHTPYGATGEYGVMLDLCNGFWIFVPSDTKESANEYLKLLFREKQLDLTEVNVKSNYGGYDSIR